MSSQGIHSALSVLPSQKACRSPHAPLFTTLAILLAPSRLLDSSGLLSTSHGRWMNYNWARVWGLRLDSIILPNCKVRTKIAESCVLMDPPEQVWLGWVSFWVMQCPSLLSWTLQDQFPEGCTGFEYDRDLHSDLSSAMARHSLKLTGSPLHFRAFFKVRPHVISGHPFGLECVTQPVSLRNAMFIFFSHAIPWSRPVVHCTLEPSLTTGSNIFNFGTAVSDLISIWERQDQIFWIWERQDRIFWIWKGSLRFDSNWGTTGSNILNLERQSQI